MPTTKRSRVGGAKEPSVATTEMNESTMQASRQASVYDAVAGRLGYDRFNEGSSSRIKVHNGFPSREAVSGPLEVLLRRVAAPQSGRADVYFADQYLAEDGRLPDSDLLKALHAYASDFYAMATPKTSKDNFRSLDGTALLALGILVEEAAVQVLGETGDMVLVEAEGLDTHMPESRANQLQIYGRVRPVETPPYVSEESSEESDEDGVTLRKKRRRRFEAIS